MNTKINKKIFSAGITAVSCNLSQSYVSMLSLFNVATDSKIEEDVFKAIFQTFLDSGYLVKTSIVAGQPQQYQWCQIGPHAPFYTRLLLELMANYRLTHGDEAIEPEEMLL